MHPILPSTICPPVQPAPLAESKDKPLPETRAAAESKSSAASFQPGEKARRNELLSKAKGQPHLRVKHYAEQEDPVSLAATAALFNSYFAALGLRLRDDTIVGYGGLTFRQECESFPGIYCGFNDRQAMQKSAESFLHHGFRPSMGVGF